jgi:hypothetical protein
MNYPLRMMGPGNVADLRGFMDLMRRRDDLTNWQGEKLVFFFSRPRFLRHLGFLRGVEF